MIRKRFTSKREVARHYLQQQVVFADRKRNDAKFGASVITMTNIKPKPETVRVFRDADTGFIYPDEESAREAEMKIFCALSKPFMSKKKRKQKVLYRDVKRNSEKYNYDMSVSNLEPYVKSPKKKLRGADMLLKKYDISVEADSRNLHTHHRDSKTPLAHPFALGKKGLHSTGDLKGSPKNTEGHTNNKSHAFQSLSQTALEGGQGHNHGFSTQHIVEDEKYIEYVPGSEIYYGSFVALQARHGGYLSFNEKVYIRASAHKPLPQARFTIMKSDDLGNRAVVKYGDAIWLQAGSAQVLGARFSGSISLGKGRRLQPTLVSSNRSNMLQAQQYGRWIVVNVDDPVGSHGKPVLHHDRVLIEQEWYYLASNTPYDSYMYKIKQGIDEAVERSIANYHKLMQSNNEDAGGKANISSVKGGVTGGSITSSASMIPSSRNADALKKEKGRRVTSKRSINFFDGGEDSIWRIKLVGITSADGSSENKRAQLLSKATDQIDMSAKERKSAAIQLLTTLHDVLPPHLHPEALKTTTLHHKESEYLEQKLLIDRFGKLSNKGFTRQPSIKFIEELYGKDSLIYMKKKQVQAIRDSHAGIEKAAIDYVDVYTHNQVDMAETRYWDNAQKLLISAQAYCALNEAMNRFYQIDFNKKVKAARMLQQCVRRYLEKKFTYSKEFAKRDKAALVKLHKMRLHQQREINLMGGSSEVSASISATNSVVSGAMVLDDFHGQVTGTKPISRSSKKNKTKAVEILDAATDVNDKISVESEAYAVSFVTDASRKTPQVEQKSERGEQSSPTTIENEEKEQIGHKSYSMDAIHADNPPNMLDEYFTAQDNNKEMLRNKSAPNLRADMSPKHIAAEEKKEREINYFKSRMSYSANNTVGLPPEVFDNYLPPTGIRTGINYLKSLRRPQSSYYQDVKAVRRNRESRVSRSADFGGSLSGGRFSTTGGSKTGRARTSHGSRGL